MTPSRGDRGWMAHRSLAGLFLLPLAANVWAQSESSIPTVESIVERVGQARSESRSRIRPYGVLRSYRLFGTEKQTAKSEVTAEITYVPPDVQHYTVHKARGLRLGEAIVRRILDSENEVLADPGASDLSAANYAFAFVREDTLNGRPWYVLALRPLRKDKKLLRGTMWVDAKSYLIHRIEGEPAAAPSWWVHDIRVTLDFRDVEGMWLQTGLLSTAKVRLLGEHTIVSRDMEYRIGGTAATAMAFSHSND